MSEMQNALSATGSSVCKIKLLFLGQCIILLGRGRALKTSVIVKFEKHSCNTKQKLPFLSPHTATFKTEYFQSISETHAQINYIIIIAHMYIFHSV